MQRLIVVVPAAAAMAAFLALPAAASDSVSVTDNAFQAGSVTIGAGETVTWHFAGTNPHSVTAADASFDSHPGCSSGTPVQCSTGSSPDFTHTFGSPGTFAYHCRVHGAAMAGTVVVEAPDTTPPAPVTGLSATPADGQVKLTWTNPVDADFAGVVVRRASGTVPPATPVDGTAAYSGTGTTVTVTGLTNGTNHSFAVFARDEVPNYSAATTATASPVPAVPAALTLARSASTVGYSAPLTLTGTLTRSDTGAGLAGERVEVWARRFGTTAWMRLATVGTGSGGSVTWTTRPAASADWVLRHPPTPYFAVVQTPPAAVQVRQRLVVRPSATTIESGQIASYAVSVAPDHSGQLVQFQQYAGGVWKSVQGRYLVGGATRFDVRPLALGTYSYRLYKGPDGDHLGAVSPVYRLTVVRRTLRPGLTGSDVLDVERRLAGLRYDVGAVDGRFDYDTTHAVAAFQKVQGLPRTSVVDQATWSRLLGTPSQPALRYPRSGTWVEVDLTRQVLYVGSAGGLYRIVDISSGSGLLFTSDGVTSRAITPTGRFRIERKINAWRTSRLGQLYRPAYFVGGYAIHGSHSVPTYPASHGCIRVTIPAMDRLYSPLAVGTPVWVYRS